MKARSHTVLSCLTLLILCSSCLTMRMNERQVRAYFKKHEVIGSRHKYRVDYRTMHYVKSGNDSLPLVLFIHGSPGSFKAFIHFLVDSSLVQHAMLIATDRPGYGYSNFGKAEPVLKKQVGALRPLLETYGWNRKVVVVGHSYGGPVAARMAMEHPEWVSGLILVAGAIDPQLEPNQTWIRAPLASPFLAWLLPRSVRTSNREIYKLKPELEKMMNRWSDIVCPVTVIQGKKDNLVPYGNAEFAARMLVNTTTELVIVDDMNHFVPWTHPQLIKDAILRMLQQPQDIHARIEEEEE
jgi:pimeloyl-ACP methyl ester carboxylesterase